MRRFVISAVLAALTCTPALAAPGDRAIEDVQVLSSDAMAGRRTGTEGNLDARLYILMRLRELGLEPIDQEFTFKRKKRRRGLRRQPHGAHSGHVRRGTGDGRHRPLRPPRRP